MDLFRVHAFSVDPLRTLDGGDNPEGGKIDITSSLRSALDRNFEAAKFNKRARVDFDVDPETRTNNVRDLIMNYAFGNSRSADESANQLSILLSEAMDLRSKPNLFIITSLRRDDLRRVVLWIFPRDTAFRFITGEESPTLQEFSAVILRKESSYFNLSLPLGFIVE